MDTNNRPGGELDPLWQKLDDLKSLEAGLDLSASPAAPRRTAGQMQAEIEGKLGFFPPHFVPALESPPLLESLWRQYVLSYSDTPLPERFRETLSIRLARYCASPYFAVVHACTLFRMGVAARQIRELLEGGPNGAPFGPEQAGGLLSGRQPPEGGWPREDAVFDAVVIAGSEAIFSRSEHAAGWAAELKRILGERFYGYLTALLATTKSAHLWVDAHPEISYEDHPAVAASYGGLIEAEPGLADLFRNYGSVLRRHPNGASPSERGDNVRYREFFENASDIIFTIDFDGRVLSVNRAIERITGYTQDEVLRMNITDVIPPGQRHVAARLTDPRTAGEVPLHHELEILSKDQKRISLGISTRPVFRGGKAAAIQGIARDITESKTIEAELQKANLKLEAWVTELEERTHEMTLLNDMGDILRACLTTEEAYNVIVRVAQQIFPVQVGALYVIAPSRNLVESVAVWGEAALAERSFTPQECWALRRGRTHWVENSRSGLICRHIHRPTSNGYLCIPMMAQSEALGILHLMQPENVRMTETKQRMAVTMAEHIAMALSNLRLHETLRSQSIRDPLTGLFNRRFMEESLELEIRRATRNQRPLGMIMMDLDHFKYFNDTFGHEAGDLLLKELSTLLKNNIRGEDIACRFGGEEFTLILPEGTGTVTRQRAEFFKEAIGRLDVHYRNQPLGQLTASMGVAVFPDHGRTAQALIAAADKALYRSKNAGRNRVTVAD